MEAEKGGPRGQREVHAGQLGCEKWDSGSVGSGTAHLDLQHTYGLHFQERDGLGRPHSDRNPLCRGREVTPAHFFASSHTHVAGEKHGFWSQAWVLARPPPATGSLTQDTSPNTKSFTFLVCKMGIRTPIPWDSCEAVMRLYAFSAPHRAWLLKEAQRELFLQLGTFLCFSSESSLCLLTWLSKLCRDFRKDLLKNFLWGHSL